MNSDEILKAELKAVAECERLREENARLRLTIHEAPVTCHPKSQHFTAQNNKAVHAGANVRKSKLKLPKLQRLSQK